MSAILAMFPGQGSQYVGMGKILLEQFPAAAEVFARAEEATSIPVRRLCLEGPEDELRLTANTQPCILTVSTALWTVLKQETGLEPAAYAGHSLGEYSALVAAGRLTFERAAYLVRRRGEAMQDAVPAGIGAMAAVMNMEPGELDALCHSISKPDSVVQTVNYNSPQQLVIAGHKSAVDQLCAALDGRGVRYVILQVSAPFHSSLMTKARDTMAPLLHDTVFTSNASRVIANLTGNVEGNFGPDLLIQQIDHPVLWTKAMDTAVALGCTAYVEIGPGKVLMGLARRCLPRTAKIITTEDIGAAIEELKQLA